MKAQLDTKVISSFLLFLDHEIQSKGEAYRNMSMQFYPTKSSYSGTYTFSAPYKSLCNDVSISGANVLSGVYINGNPIQVGQSGLKSINHYEGALYFTGINPAGAVISGDAAVKEVNVKLTNKPDWKLLFETKYTTNGSVIPTTGLDIDAETAPIVFVRVKQQENLPFAFSKLDNQRISLRCIVIADNEYQKIALTSIIKNMNYRALPLVVSTPFDYMGNMTGVNYDYTTLTTDSTLTPIVLGVKSIDVPQDGDYKDILRNMAICDLDIGTVAKS